MSMSYCKYYQAKIDAERAWYFVAALRSYEHIVFDRTIDVANSIFEFFVPEDMESHFLQVMQALENEGLVSQLSLLPNRLCDGA